MEALEVILDRLGIPRNYGRDRRLRREREARRLAAIGRDALERRIDLSPGAAKAWGKMWMAAGREGVELVPLSGFRSVKRQAEIIREKLADGEDLAEILRFVAAPGYSEHHTGRAIDIGEPEEAGFDEKFGRTRAFRWLRKNAGRFGFRLSYERGNRHGFAYEPWHWCYHARK